ncbi:MAG TPA: Na+/H+ antiporter [Solirubrobacterales bacterium]|nr:Na+/H+ antiporter [Solirubrobacterales bacterium]
MNEIELLILLAGVAAVLVRLADLIGIPYPIVLVLAGLGIGFLPGGPTVHLEPEIIFLVFLPPLLQAAGYYASPQDLRAQLAPLTWLVLGLVLATMIAVAAVAQAVIPGISWPEGLLLGAIVAPTDPVAAIATFERVGITERVRLLIEGESMINDATGLVAYRVMLAAVVSGTFSAGEAVVDLIVAVAGGIGIGLAVAWVALQVLRRLDDIPLTIFTSVLMAYVSFALAEEIEASGVLAAVTAGLYLGWHANEVFSAEMRLSGEAFWEALVFALNVVLFILLGLQAPDVLERVGDQYSAGELAGYGLLVAAVVIAVRLIWQVLPELLEKLFPPAGALATGEDWRERLLIGWSGMRGALSLAAALALPLTLDSGEPFVERDLILFLTVAVILVTLVGQGLTLPPLIKALGLSTTKAWAPDEAVVRLALAQAALDRIDQLEVERPELPDEAIDRMRQIYQARFARCLAQMSGEEGGSRLDDPAGALRKLRRELIELERGELVRARNEGRIKPDVQRRIQRELDLEEARLSDSEPATRPRSG